MLSESPSLAHASGCDVSFACGKSVKSTSGYASGWDGPERWHYCGPESLGLFLCRSASRFVFLRRFSSTAFVKSTPVWLARHTNTKRISAISSDREEFRSDGLKLWSPNALDISLANSPTSSIKTARLVSSEK